MSKQDRPIPTAGYFWVCFDMSNHGYLRWFKTRREAMEFWNEQTENPRMAKLSLPRKVVLLPESV